MQTPERDVMRAVLGYLQARGFYHFRANVGAMKSQTGRLVRFGHAGLPDIIGMLPDGRFLAIECKSANGKATEAQLAFLRMVNQAGGVGILARNVEDVDTRLCRALRGRVD